MKTGTIKIQDGRVVEVVSADEGGRSIVGGQPVYSALKDLQAMGWKVKGEIPESGTGTVIIEKED